MNLEQKANIVERTPRARSISASSWLRHGRDASLAQYGVAAHSANNVWAVGQQVGNQAPNRALVLHWDGATWSPAPVADDPETDRLISVDLYGVAATANSHRQRHCPMRAR